MPIFRYNEQPGNYYAYLIESSGDDANDGLTPETAVESLDRLVEILDTYAGADRRHAVIVKKRIYNEGITYSRNSTKPITFEFMGGCEIDGSGASVLRSTGNGDLFIGCSIINYTTTYFKLTGASEAAVVDFNKVVFKNNTAGLLSSMSTGPGPTWELNNCLVIDTRFSSVGNVHLIKGSNNVFINCTGGAGLSRSNLELKNCIFFDTTYGDVNDAFVLDYCCIYNSTIDGHNQAGLIALGKNLNGISANPQFTDPTNGQYTVNQSSPCLYRGEGGEHIGIGEGFYLQANIIYFQQSVINNFQLTTGRLGFIDPLDNAFIETNPIDIGHIITTRSGELAAILPVVGGEFTAGPVSYSDWYPAYSAA